MKPPSSSTVADTSDVAARVAGALRRSTEGQDSEKIARSARLSARIKDLESRGFIRRQSFSAPTTGDFEKLLLCRKPL